ncbi:MAG: hypothetical protein KY391_06905 [Actinobacteria bacterium]|nr:hypothetical protein [Actinomycetota bacterium]
MTDDTKVSYLAQIAPGLVMAAAATIGAAILIGNQAPAARGDGWRSFWVVGAFAALVMLAFGKRLLHPDETGGSTPVIVLTALGIAVAVGLRNSSAEIAGAITGAIAGAFAGFALLAIVLSILDHRAQRHRATAAYEGPELRPISEKDSDTSKLS